MTGVLVFILTDEILIFTDVLVLTVKDLVLIVTVLVLAVKVLILTVKVLILTGEGVLTGVLVLILVIIGNLMMLRLNFCFFSSAG